MALTVYCINRSSRKYTEITLGNFRGMYVLCDQPVDQRLNFQVVNFSTKFLQLIVYPFVCDVIKW